MSFYELVMRITGTDHYEHGSHNPPEAAPLRYIVSDQAVEIVSDRTARDYRVIAAGNDGFELWFGTRDRWSHHMSQQEVAALTRWLIVDWYIRSRWLGLRRPIYYWALRRSLRMHKRRQRSEAAIRTQVAREIREWAGPMRREDGSIDTSAVAREATMRERVGLPSYIAELDGPGKVT